MAINKLTDIECRYAKVPAGQKTIKLGDGGGLHLWMNQKGIKSFRLNYTNPNTNKPDTFVIGHYPSPISLVEARAERDRVGELIAAGFDPKVAVKVESQERVENHSGERSLYGCAEKWVEKQRATKWKNASTRRDRENVLMKGLKFNLPGKGELGKLFVGDVTPDDLLVTIRAVESRSLFASQMLAWMLNAIFNEYEVFKFRGELANPMVVIKTALQKPVPGPGHQALPENELGALLKIFDDPGAKHEPVYYAATHFYLLTVTRVANIATMEWADVDWDKGHWTIPAKKMKGKRGAKRHDHLVPLSRQALELLAWIRDQGWSDQWVFPNNPNANCGRNPHMKPARINDVLRERGINCVAHGLRTTFSTAVNERNFGADHIETQLDHVIPGVRGVYNKARWLDERTVMMQWWADFLDLQKGGPRRKAGNVVELKRKVA